MKQNILQVLRDKKLVHPPKWLPDNIHYLAQVGSVSYGANIDNSDIDVSGFCIPPKELIFPHLAGQIEGFGIQKERFDQYQEHHIVDKERDQEFDFAIYSIVKFFQLCMENNPNMCDTLFVPQRCVLYSSKIGQLVRDRRKIFLHKGSYHKFRGYAYSSLHKIGAKANSKNPKRQLSIDAHGYDTKFALHVVRLALEAEQILVEHDLDLERNSEILKSVRRGDWTETKLREWFDVKEKTLEEQYAKSTLQHAPDEEEIKRLLVESLEHHYGSLDHAVRMEVPVDQVLSELQNLINKYT